MVTLDRIRLTGLLHEAPLRRGFAFPETSVRTRGLLTADCSMRARCGMQIGKPGEPVTHMSQAYPDRIEVRGRDLAGDLMGRLTFTEYFHLLVTGREPTEEERYFLDLLLVAIAEHGMMPTNVAARMTLAADPGSLQGAVAAGILGAGPVVLGTAEECARLLVEAQRKVEAGGEPTTVAGELAAAIKDKGAKVPGFGHPVHRPVDPRSERILELADERGVSGPHVVLARAFRDGVAEAWGKRLTMNVAMPMAAVMLDLGFSADTVKAIPILARTAGLLAHLAEEHENPVGFLLAGAAEEAVTYEPRDE
jgi:citrate synthase